MHRGDSGGDGMNALAVRSDPSYSYIWIFALTESLEGFGRGNPTARPEATERKILSLLELPIDIPRLIQPKSELC